MGKKTILFDIGNVFLKPIHGEIINMIFEKKKNHIQLEDYKCEVASILNKSFEGIISLEETWTGLFNLADIREGRQEIIHGFKIKRNEELIDYVSNILSKKNSIGIISDLSQIGYDVFKNNYKELYNSCDEEKVFISVNTGRTKSKNGKEYFEEISNILNIKPNELIFIDDEIHNIECAQKANFRTILFESHDYNWKMANQKIIKKLEIILEEK